MASIFPKTTAPTPQTSGRGRDYARFTEGETEAPGSQEAGQVSQAESGGAGTGHRSEPQNGIPDSKGSYSGQQKTPSLLTGHFHFQFHLAPAFPGPRVRVKWARAGEGPARCRPASVSPLRRLLTAPSGPRRPQPQPHLSLRAFEPRELQAADPRPVWLSVEHPPTHLSGGRTPTRRRLRLRTAALSGPAPGCDACAEKGGSRWISFCAGASIIEAGVGRSDVI